MQKGAILSIPKNKNLIGGLKNYYFYIDMKKLV